MLARRNKPPENGRLMEGGKKVFPPARNLTRSKYGDNWRRVAHRGFRHCFDMSQFWHGSCILHSRTMTITAGYRKGKCDHEHKTTGKLGPAHYTNRLRRMGNWWRQVGICLGRSRRR